MKYFLLVLVLPLAILAGPTAVQAQDPILDRIKALEERLKRAEEENVKLREDLQGKTPMPPPGKNELDIAIDRALEAREDEKTVIWKDLTSSGNPIQFYGFLRLDAYFNSARPNHPSAAMWVMPENNVIAKENDDSFVFEARWTRLGLKVNAGEICGAAVTGRLETDFANYVGGVAESRAPIRIRLAYMDVDCGNLSFRFGQDWDIIAPLYPSVHLAGLMWNVGNLGDRRPMAQACFKAAASDDLTISARVALGLTGALDNQDLDALPPGISTVQDGFDSGLPHLQARFAVKTGLGMEFGVWGYVSSLETDTSLPFPQGKTKHFRGQCMGLDMFIPIGDQIKLKGEAWIGQALSDMRGGIGQSINTFRGREIESFGGWAEVSFKADDIFTFSLGASIDDPKNDDLTRNIFSATPLNHRKKNFTLYAGSSHNWGGGFKTGLDVIFWETDWLDHGIGNMLRCNFYSMLSF